MSKKRCFFQLRCLARAKDGSTHPFFLRIETPKLNERGINESVLYCEGLLGLPSVATGLGKAKCRLTALAMVQRRLLQENFTLIDDQGQAIDLPLDQPLAHLGIDWDDLDVAHNAILFQPLRTGPRPPCAPFELSCWALTSDGDRWRFDMSVPAPTPDPETGGSPYQAPLTCPLMSDKPMRCAGEDPVQAYALAFELVWSMITDKKLRLVGDDGQPVIVPRYAAWSFGAGEWRKEDNT